jgi:mRNA-degrading endonuclease RelE of RelBE toxin-antitoxin system
VTVELTERAAKDLVAIRRAQPAIHDRIVRKIQTLAENPTAGKPLVGPLKGKWSLCIGEYRAIYEPYKRAICILTVSHRKEVYR